MSYLDYGPAPNGVTSHQRPKFAAEQIKYATAFLQWLGERNSTLASCGQIDIDASIPRDEGLPASRAE